MPPRTPRVVEEPEPPTPITVTRRTDKNGATVLMVEGRTYARNNSVVEVHAGEHVYHGGTAINGEFRAFIPDTDEAITVVVDGEVVP